jgi:hypothetical protein
MPQSHRLSRRAVLEVTELADEPLLRLSSSFASHCWFEAACQVRAYSAARAARKRRAADADRIGPDRHGVAVVPSPVRIPRTGVRAAVVVHRGVSIGRWTVAAWDSRASCAYACNSSKSWPPLPAQLSGARIQSAAPLRTAATGEVIN